MIDLTYSEIDRIMGALIMVIVASVAFWGARDTSLKSKRDPLAKTTQTLARGVLFQGGDRTQIDED